MLNKRSNNNFYKNYYIKGFTLIELSVVIVIIGILIAGFLAAARVHVEQRRIEAMAQKIDEIRKALVSYIADDTGVVDEVRYPCPSSLTALPGSPDFGRELCPPDFSSISAGQDLGGVYVINGSYWEFGACGGCPNQYFGNFRN